MKIKTNVRAGSGGSTASSTSTVADTSLVSGKGGVNQHTGIDNTVVAAPPPVVYYPPVARCAGY
jgi:hypothetical protein